MVDIQRIEWEEFPARKPRVRAGVRPEFEAVRALKIGEAIKFPCTWKHYLRFGKYDICTGKSGTHLATRHAYPERYIEAVCVDKVIYVRRTNDRSWVQRMEE